jgi:predicted GIY-YIG superfamily endonuclease
VTQALKREHQLKRWTRTKKEALIAGDVAKLKGTKPSEAKRLTAEA